MPDISVIYKKIEKMETDIEISPKEDIIKITICCVRKTAVEKTDSGVTPVVAADAANMGWVTAKHYIY